ncbi:RanGTP-binding protein-domain-containing protein [Podospora appendiculata]|uniref:RanGTP-binding protein-domain-containing protein n=1 Tax=Podospora appendiculata TaxID=314037 RepID=A0AAE1C885_9PEZI|nr:RanGTP-binding protein-domain-containing protein [Podospora appendiculata]
MDLLLARLGVQALNYAIRSGIRLTSVYAVQQCSRLLKTVNDRAVYVELKALQQLLDNKIKILSPAIDLIEFKSSRGNVFLESAVPLAKSLHREIVRLGKRLDDAATVEEGSRLRDGKAHISEARHAELLQIIRDMQSLLARIDREIPLIQLAISASGEKMTTALSPGISPSRLMQASTFLSFGDAQFSNDPTRPVQVGPSFTLSLYMLFLGHSQPAGQSGKDETLLSTPERFHNKSPPKEEPYGLEEGERKPIWQEVMHKARVRLCRTPLDWTFDGTRGFCPNGTSNVQLNGNSALISATGPMGRPDEYAYHLEMIEDLDDGRVHDEQGAKTEAFNDIAKAGIRESIPIHQIAKIFYTDTGRILNIGNADEGENNPVLLLKRDVKAKTSIKLRQEWLEGPSDSDTDIDTKATSSLSDDQAEIDRQLLEESQPAGVLAGAQAGSRKDCFPQHLDPEWLALEVFMEYQDSEDSEDEDDMGGGKIEQLSSDSGKKLLPTAGSTRARDRSSIDSNLAAQIRNISLQSPSPARVVSRLPPGDVEKETSEPPESWVTRSPFGSIVSSLSLLEMLVRLTSLQEFQQTSHLSIPDHILTFFLEETSTTGLQGEARWQVRNEAKRRMGFDPYTDTPTK